MSSLKDQGLTQLMTSQQNRKKIYMSSLKDQGLTQLITSQKKRKKINRRAVSNLVATNVEGTRSIS